MPIVAAKIKRLGGDLAYVAMDEPLYYGHYPTGGCQSSIADLASQINQTYVAFRAEFPAVQLGDIEPYFQIPSGSWLSDVSEFFDAIYSATGVPLAFVHDDAAIESSQYQQRTPSFISLVHQKHIPYGLIRDGSGTAQSNIEWVNSAISRISQYNSLGYPTPEQNIFQSWDLYPNIALPPENEGSLTHVIKVYFGI